MVLPAECFGHFVIAADVFQRSIQCLFAFFAFRLLVKILIALVVVGGRSIVVLCFVWFVCICFQCRIVVQFGNNALFQFGKRHLQEPHLQHLLL